MSPSTFRRALVSAVLALAATVAAGAGCASRRGGGAPADGPAAADPALARAENERALQLLAQGKDPEAEQALRRALAADSSYWQTWNNLGLVYYRADDLYPAAKAFDQAMQLMPGRPEPHNNLGLIYERSGQLPKAEAAYAEARRLEPDNPEYLGNLARARVRRGDRDPGTRRLLEELVLRDTRPLWVDWARRSLLRLSAEPPAFDPATAPSVPQPPG